MFRTLQLDRREGLATVWMNRPEVHNAFDDTLIAELTEALLMLDSDVEVRVVVLGGRGESFCAGADLNWMKRAAGYSEAENLRDARALAEMLRSLALMSKPTLARVQGAAIGGGLGLVAGCDIAVASTRASFATSEVRLGLIPATIGPYVIAAIGERQARRYFLTGERISASRALEIGLAHEVTEAERLDATVASIADALIAGGPQAQTAAKHLIQDITGRPLTAELAEDTACRIAGLRATPEAGEGIRAFLQKQPPAWRVKC
ncbi:MAG: enoyl-CoA hydratase/isomerase family protein [Rhodospirillales bacterium]|nr:enoyl-CoA hydratase/isomerase family protein [Rhodospirillales bacterium]